MNEYKRYIVTSALPYANGPLHIGHLAGAYLSADIYVRFQRLMGKDILFICGSDEHGAAITIKALKEGVTPQQVIDKYHTLFESTFTRMGISFDMYHRTSDPLHHATSQEIFNTLYDKNEFEIKESEQYFDQKHNKFLADRYITGTCPKCAHPEAYGDQCENCGSSLSPTELINPKSTLSGETPILKKTKHWYLPLDKYEDWLRDWIDTGQLHGVSHHDVDQWKNHVMGQCKSWLDGGLQSRAMTRDLDWGVDVPHNIEGHEGKKLYVWMDAPIGYISATKAWALKHNKDWKKYWQNNDSGLIHFIGKDNIVFHCIIFPAILNAHGKFNLPINVPANQFMNLEGRKISTSKNWAVWVHEYLDDFDNKADELRYNMIKNMPELKDSEFTWKGFQDSTNNELVNNLANFVNRVFVLTEKYFDGRVPRFDEDQDIIDPSDSMECTYHDAELITLFDMIDELGQYIRQFDFRNGLKTVMDICTRGNQILQMNEPWKKIKEEPESVAVVMNLTLQYVTSLSIVIRPFLPFASDKLRQMLNLKPITEKGEWVKMMDHLAEGFVLIKHKHNLQPSVHLFSKIEDQAIQIQIDKLNMSSAQNDQIQQMNKSPYNHTPIKESIQYEDFDKMDIRVATIIEAEKVDKTDKLLKLTLDLGIEKRTVVSGIALSYEPKDIIGKKVSLLANLAPKKIKGIESRGMILMAGSDSDALLFINPDAADCENGIPVK